MEEKEGGFKQLVKFVHSIAKDGMINIRHTRNGEKKNEGQTNLDRDG